MESLDQLLKPFTAGPLSGKQLDQLQTYLDLLLKWNAKISLTAIRRPEDIVQRHFGESLFAGEQLQISHSSSTLIDFGSGAGFPGMPIKIFAPHLQVTLIEAQQKKAAFLREVIRALELKNVSVCAGRAEESQLKAEIVTMRAVEKFEAALPAALGLLSNRGRLALLVGSGQAEAARNVLSNLTWQPPIRVPRSQQGILLIGQAPPAS